jgi:S-adenosylmethionine:tRNA ribosyltransferase-isomerase
VELRLPGEKGTQPFYQATRGEMLQLPEGATVTLLAPARGASDGSAAPNAPTRLWLATLSLPIPWPEYLKRYGFPIRYGYVRQFWPIEYYQTVYVTEEGSAEMPSAGRAFTPELITQLTARGVQFAPLILHTGVASLENHEPPYAKVLSRSGGAARTVNAAREADRHHCGRNHLCARTGDVTDRDGVTHIPARLDEHRRDAGAWHPFDQYALTGLRTTRYAPAMPAVAGQASANPYAEALRERYLWHEFGDLHLILP